MITNVGKTQIKRYLGGLSPSVAGYMAFGINNAAAAATQTRLQFETARSPLELVSYDFVNDKVVFKADLPEDFSGTVYEIGLFVDSGDTESGSRLITTFDSFSEDWTDSSGALASFTNGNRVGDDALAHNVAASATRTSNLSAIELDLSAYTGADLFSFAFSVADANNSSVTVRFMTDTANYFTFNLGTQSAGYKFIQATKSSAVATGVPDWSLITQIQIVTVAKSTGVSNVFFDAIRIEDSDANAPEVACISRQVLTTPVTKLTGQGRTFEYSLGVTIA